MRLFVTENPFSGSIKKDLTDCPRLFKTSAVITSFKLLTSSGIMDVLLSDRSQGNKHLIFCTTYRHRRRKDKFFFGGGYYVGQRGVVPLFILARYILYASLASGSLSAAR